MISNDYILSKRKMFVAINPFAALLTNQVRHNFREPQLSPLTFDFGPTGLKMTANRLAVRPSFLKSSGGGMNLVTSVKVIEDPYFCT